MNKLEPHSSLPNTLLANLPIRLFISPVKILSQSTVAKLSFTHFNTDDWLVPKNNHTLLMTGNLHHPSYKNGVH